MKNYVFLACYCELNRRRVLQRFPKTVMVAAMKIFLGAMLLATALALRSAEPASANRPDIVWIVGEDMGPELGCYGDRNAITPNIDRLAREGVRFTRAFTHAPVCAPSRSGLITGMYPTTIGTQHMRSELLKAPRTFSSYMRDAGCCVAWPVWRAVRLRSRTASVQTWDRTTSLIHFSSSSRAESASWLAQSGLEWGWVA